MKKEEFRSLIQQGQSVRKFLRLGKHINKQNKTQKRCFNLEFTMAVKN